ncbi:hypothetical protein JQX13_14140 [Archangium violaceum]|uniref:hypothetical protein n=1 Tax=Archangium violaceum TaxID=83451 RepID=UPI00193C09B1|nr:hypothetical protein [Archangium violaceum]QRK11104.1 hypothetical protein JQX13_14140 [Archangium violaceum]
MTLKKAMIPSTLLAATLCVALVGGCGGTQFPQEENAPNFQGDNLGAGESTGGGGGVEGPSSGGDDWWVTLCHIPPGNHSRAHTITVGQPAVKAHLKHGDRLGACEGSDAGTPPDQDGGTAEPDAGEPPEPQPDAGTGEPPGPQPDAGTGEPGDQCRPEGFECDAEQPCCDGLQCSEGTCTVILG